MTEWKRNRGKMPKIDPDTVVEYRSRNGTIGVGRAGRILWGIDGEEAKLGFCDIMAWRVAGQNKKQKESKVSAPKHKPRAELRAVLTEKGMRETDHIAKDMEAEMKEPVFPNPNHLAPRRLRLPSAGTIAFALAVSILCTLAGLWVLGWV